MEISENICRICLAGGTTDIDCLMVDIFEEKKEFSIPDVLQIICGLEVSEESQLPRLICVICYSRLADAYNLREQCRQAHETLVVMFNNTRDSGKCEENEQDGMFDIEYLDDPEEDVQETGEEITEIKEELVEDMCAIDIQDTVIEDELVNRCCGCDKSYKTELELRKHSIRLHRRNQIDTTEEGKVQCNVCFGNFSSAYKLKIHKTGKNNLKSLQKCNYCGCIFFSSSGLLNHQKLFHTDKLFKCCRCDFSSLEISKLLLHVEEHREVNPSKFQASRYQCNLCLTRFENAEDVRTHERYPYRKFKTKQSKSENSIDFNVIRCCGCPKIFNSTADLRDHQEKVHFPQRTISTASLEGELSIECGGCYRTFRSDSMLQKHLQRAAKRKLYACSKCSVSRRTLKELKEHEATHMGRGAFICCGCRKGFETQDALDNHSLEIHAKRPKIYHNDASDTERPFECPICYRRYKTSRDLRGHQRYVYYDKAHMCEICGKGFAQESILTVHMARHKSEANFPCPICGKKYKHETIVRDCITRHNRPKEHKCKICNVRFSGASNLYSHMISHSEDRRYKCDICGQKFKRSFHLRKHKSIHTSERNYPCRYCPSRFSSTTELYKHEIRHTGQYPYECSLCSKKLTTRQVYIKHFESHIEDRHKIFCCEICPQRFSQNHFLSNHIKYTHRIEPQDKNWNEKFNRRGPRRTKGGSRVAGVRFIDTAGACEPEETTPEIETMSGLEIVDEEVELENDCE
ncbi:zinc finger protein ZFP2-like [Wyeomyia smithii]|uniref:zinc finger protein ZFP2-like n=1 Tax=Wyeomyia smithii TaxID=174621 RepID=UPI0024681E47|nr:zinc finger protein ZFP2-like [Wyeomyia smithii]